MSTDENNVSMKHVNAAASSIRDLAVTSCSNIRYDFVQGEYSWPVPSRCSPASGPICRWKTCAARPATSATTASSWRAGAITSKSTRRRPIRTTAAAKRDLLDRYDLQCHAISSHLVGQAVCDRIDQRHKVDPAAARVGRRRPGRRQPPRGRGDEEHGPRRAAARRRRRQRLHRLEHLAAACIRSRRCPIR